MADMMVRQIHSLLIPLAQDFLLLPNAAVAEVVHSTASIEQIETSKLWFIGLLPWRKLSVPLISYDAALGGQQYPPQGRGKQKYAIIKAVGNDPEFKFFALITAGIPQLTKIDKATISPMPDRVEDNPFISKFVFVKDLPAMIPDLEYAERSIKELLIMEVSP